MYRQASRLYHFHISFTGRFVNCILFVSRLQAGLIEEMLEDTMEGFEDQDELEDEAQEEVDKVLWELTAGQKKCSSNFCLLSKILDQNMFPKYIRKCILCNVFRYFSFM